MPRHNHNTSNTNTYRFFVPATAFQAGTCELRDPELVHQVGTVLRLKPGDSITLLDGQGWEYRVVISTLDRRSLTAHVESRQQVDCEPHVILTLFCPLIRAERFEWLLQKGTELGVARFVPVLYAHTVHGDSATAGRKAERWTRIIREAAEQSWRGRLPELAPALSFAAALQQARICDLALLLWEAKNAEPLRDVLHTAAHSSASAQPSLAILSGPEGGLSQAELEQALAAGVRAVTLGPRILRAETAPLVALSAVLYAYGEMS